MCVGEEKWHLRIHQTIKQCLCDLSAGFTHSFHDVICATASRLQTSPRLAALQPSVTDTLCRAFQQMLFSEQVKYVVLSMGVGICDRACIVFVLCGNKNNL